MHHIKDNTLDWIKLVEKFLNEGKELVYCLYCNKAFYLPNGLTNIDLNFFDKYLVCCNSPFLLYVGAGFTPNWKYDGREIPIIFEVLHPLEEFLWKALLEGRVDGGN